MQRPFVLLHVLAPFVDEGVLEDVWDLLSSLDFQSFFLAWFQMSHCEGQTTLFIIESNTTRSLVTETTHPKFQPARLNVTYVWLHSFADVQGYVQPNKGLVSHLNVKFLRGLCLQFVSIPLRPSVHPVLPHPWPHNQSPQLFGGTVR